MPTLKVLELFHGIGGLRAGMEEAEKALNVNVQTEVGMAIDISTLCAQTYQHNFGTGKTFERDIKSLPDQFFEEMQADIWVMSPPCQPYTVRGNKLDFEDPRAEGLARLVRYIRTGKAIPSGILLENVPGFESSSSLLELETALELRGYAINKSELCPTMLSIPNRRRRFYLTAVRASKFHSGMGNLKAECSIPLRDFLSGDQETWYSGGEKHQLPASYLRYGQALDVVTPDSTESNCFTGAYGRYAKGSGSVLDLSEWGQRLFSPQEILRIHAFPAGFEFPESLPAAKAYKLIGNSVNVRVVGALSRELLTAVAATKQQNVFSG